MLIGKIAVTLYIVLSDEHEPTTALAWLLVVTILPAIGIILYLVLGRNLRHHRLFDLKRAEEIRLLPTVRRQQAVMAEQRLTAADVATEAERDLMGFLLRASQATVTADNSVQVISHGDDHIRRLLGDLEQAQRFIHLQYFIIRDDIVGGQVLRVLERQAAAGVEVKVLYDGLGSLRLPGGFFRRLHQAGGKTAAFFPPSLANRYRLNFRNHRKICVIDGQVGYLGGFNIGDEYAGRPEKFSAWRDLQLRLAGGAVDSLELRFLLDWRFVTQDHLHSSHYFPERAKAAGQVRLQIAASGPDTRWQPVKEGLLKLINLARRHIYLETPYFIPDSSMLDALRLAALSGVTVKVILPGHPDHPFVLPAGMSYLGDLLEAGVQFFFYQHGFLHSKMLTVDSTVSTVGSANFDLRSFKVNFEVNAFIYDRQIASELETIFADDLRQSVELTLAEYQQRGSWQRTREAFARLLAPLL